MGAVPRFLWSLMPNFAAVKKYDMSKLIRFMGSGMMVFVAVLGANAESFSFEGIIYNITSDSTCEVGRQTPSEISGAVVLPSSVSDESGKSYTLTAISNFAFVTCSALTEVSIPESVTNVGNSSFSKCNALKVVRFAGAPATVGSNCFSESEAIAEVYTPGFARWISTDFKDASASPLRYGASLFDSTAAVVDCSIIPDGTTRIGNFSLAYIKNLEAVTLPNSLEEIGMGAFTGSPVKIVNIPSLDSWTRITFGNYTANPLYSGAVLAVDGTEVENLDIPEGVEAVNNYAFMNYMSAEAINIPSSVKTVGTQAFSGCKAVKTLSLGEGVETIGMNAFQNVDFTTISCNAVNPPELSRNAFSNASYSDAVLTVPKGSLEAYKTASQWQKFLNIKEDGTTGVEHVGDDVKKQTIYYKLSGQKIDNPTSGIYIMKQGSRTAKVMIK